MNRRLHRAGAVIAAGLLTASATSCAAKASPTDSGHVGVLDRPTSSTLATSRPPTTGTPARLHVSGSQLETSGNRPIVLRGYNWGQWGTAQPQDAADNVSQGANSVRIPLRWWGRWKPGVNSYSYASPGYIDPAHLQQLDRTVARASSNHLWIVLFVDSNYGQGADGTTDFWNDPRMRARFFTMWRFLAHRYAHTPYLAALELLPEPRPPKVSDAAVHSFYDSLIRSVRTVDKRTPLVIGPNEGYNAAHLDAAYTNVDHNLIYTADYFIFDHPLNKLSQIEAFRSRYHAAVWVNQVGIPSAKADSASKADEVLAALDKAKIGWAWWTYRDQGSSAGGEGIYYYPDGRWTVKKGWLALVGSYLETG